MMRKRLAFYVLMLPLTLMWIACSESDSSSDEGNWIKGSDFEGNTRSGAVAFTIGEYAYVGLGSDGDDYLLDFWRFDQSKNYWERMADFPGAGRISSVSFSIDGKGYVGTGFNDDLDEEELQDFWQYDPSANEWIQLADFPGGGRYSAVGFAVGGDGYIGTGYNGSYLKDFFKFDPSTGEWSAIVSIYGSKRESAVAFVIDDIAYVGSGRNNGSYIYDFYSYDPTIAEWTNLSLTSDDDTYDTYVTALARYGAVAITVDGVAYVGTGIADSYTTTFYQYDPTTNEWNDDIQSFEGSARSAAVAFSVNNVGYVTTGRNSSQRFDDIWEFDPDGEYDEYD